MSLDSLSMCHKATRRASAHVMVLSHERRSTGDTRWVLNLPCLGLAPHLLDGLVAELGEATLAGLGVGLLAGPLLGGGIKELLTPQPEQDNT
eukprot:1145159-Pelagomonas_calceolata.AAC.6